MRALAAMLATTALLTATLAMASPAVSASAPRSAIPMPLRGTTQSGATQNGEVQNIEPMPGIRVQIGRDLSASANFDGGADLAPLSPTGKSAFSSYESLSDGGGFVSAVVALANNLQFRFGAGTVSSEQRLAQSPQAASRALTSNALLPRQSTAGTAAVTWSFAPWGQVSLNASGANEHASFLGGTGPVAGQASSAGVSARLGLGQGWVTTFSYREGATQLSGSLTPQNRQSQAYAIALSKKGLFNARDSFAVAVSQPGLIYTGGIDLAAPSGVDLTNSLIGRSKLAFGPSPETDVELGYATTFFNGALALQANAGYQMNVAGQNGNNAVSVVSRAKINF